MIFSLSNPEAVMKNPYLCSVEMRKAEDAH